MGPGVSAAIAGAVNRSFGSGGAGGGAAAGGAAAAPAAAEAAPAAEAAAQVDVVAKTDIEADTLAQTALNIVKDMNSTIEKMADIFS